MKRLIDTKCPACEQTQIDVWADLEHLPLCACGAQTERLWSMSAGVVADDIPGGMLIYHGLCNDDGSPRRYYSKSEIAAEAKRRGLVNRVEHVHAPRARHAPIHTTRWI